MEFEDRNGPDDTLLMEQQIELTDFPNTDEVKEVILGEGLLSNAHLLSSVVLKLLHELVRTQRLSVFIKEHIRIKQKITRTSDDMERYSSKQRLMLEVSKDGR